MKLLSRLYGPLFYTFTINKAICVTPTMESLSGLSFIEVKYPSNPFPLLKEWLEEGRHYRAQTSLMNLATASKNGKVSNRTIVIRDTTPDGCLVFTAQAASNKVKDITENPQVAATILMLYVKNQKNISRQIRVSGIAVQLSKEQCKIYYEKEKLPAKIRSWICQNSGPVQWNELKLRHDELLKEVTENKKILDMPDTQVAYKIVANEIDFYFSCGDDIADRILYKKDEKADWTFERLTA